jgi:hypothetical protein
MSTPTVKPIKVGDSIVIVGTYRQNGVPTSITPYTVTSQVRNSSGVLVMTFVVTPANQAVSPGIFSLAPAVNPPVPAMLVDVMSCDIQFVTTATGIVRSSQTFLIPFVSEITVP